MVPGPLPPERRDAPQVAVGAGGDVGGAAEGEPALRQSKPSSRPSAPTTGAAGQPATRSWRAVLGRYRRARPSGRQDGAGGRAPRRLALAEDGRSPRTSGAEQPAGIGDQEQWTWSIAERRARQPTVSVAAASWQPDDDVTDRATEQTGRVEGIGAGARTSEPSVLAIA